VTPERDRPLRVHWGLLIAILGVLALGLALQLPGALLTPTLYRAWPVGSAAGVPTEVQQGGPGIGLQNGTVTVLAPKAKTIALTFDDGPDPIWTPRILAVLRKYGVHGTFFVVGDHVLRSPGVLNEVVKDGNEVGVHSFTHPDLGRAGDLRTLFELRSTQLMIGGSTGLTTALFRPPYSSSSDAVDDAAWSTIKEASAEGYLTVLSTRDSRDWEQRNPDAVIGAVTPTGDEGQVVLFHDGGGDRSTTVAALDRLIPLLQSRGYTVTTAGAALGLKEATTATAPITRVLTGVLVGGLVGCVDLVLAVQWAMIAAGAVAVLRAILLLATARKHRRVTGGRALAPGGDPVTVIVPAYNEEAGIEAAVRSLLASSHPVEVIVVDDGSTDSTSAIVEGLRLPQVRLVRQANAGKPAALNTGIARTRTDLVVMVDGDTVFEPDTVARLVAPFADPSVGAVSGNAKVANRGGFLGRWQHIEYVIGFNMDRRWYDLARCMPTVPGAVGAFRTEALRAVGGVSDETLAEDTDLTLALGAAGWRIVYVEDARAWTEVPATLRALWRQRYRWCYGTLQSMWKHRAEAFRGGPGGRHVRRALAYMTVFQVLFPLMAPAVDLFAVYGLIVMDPLRVLAVWGAFQVLDQVIAQYAFRLDGERRGVLWTLPLTQFCYRQLLYLVVIQSLFTAFAGTRLPWQRVERYGTFGVTPGSP